MNFLHQTNPRIALAVMAGAVLVVASLRLMPERTDNRIVAAEVNGAPESVASLGPARQSPAEFHAARKRVQIERLVSRIRAALPAQDQLQRSEYFVQQVASLSPEDVPLVLQALDVELRGSEFGVLLLRRWVEDSPSEAAYWAVNVSSGEERDGFLGQVGTVWAAVDGKAALEWAKSIRDENGRQAALRAIAEETLRYDVNTTLVAATSLSSETDRQDLTIRAVNEWAVREPLSALKWLTANFDDAGQNPLREALVPVIAGLDGASGARLVTAWMRPGEAQERAAVTVVQHWVQQAPEQAAEWVNHFPEGPMRVVAMENLKRIRAATTFGTSAETLALP